MSLSGVSRDAITILTGRVLHSDQQPPSLILLNVLIRIVQLRPHALSNNLKAYYKMLSRYGNVEQVGQGEEIATLLKRAIIAPLMTTKDTSGMSRCALLLSRGHKISLANSTCIAAVSQRAYHAYATLFLTRQQKMLEHNVSYFAQQISTNALSQTVVDIYGPPTRKPNETTEELLWLLAHAVDLQRNVQRDSHNSLLYLRAIHTQLSYLATDVRMRFANSQDSHGDDPPGEAYLSAQIRSLVDENEIKGLLTRFTASQATAAEQDYASLLAGYALVLIRCFPDKGDSIRMLFFLSDFSTKDGLLPAVRFFWDASSATSVLHCIVKSPKDTLDLLLRRESLSAAAGASTSNNSWDLEWRTLLLFLELYTFVLRLTDDDDFFSAIQDASPSFRETSVTPNSRLRSSALPLPALQTLTVFLKNLSFTLLYNAANLLDQGPSHDSLFLNKQRRSSQVGNYHVVSGVDFFAFKSIVTTAIQMLYERDSRRQFLPNDHWLMTSYFDMAQILPAVVSEEQRQRDIQQSDGDEADDVDMDVDETEDDMDESHHAISFTSSRTSRYAMLERARRQREKLQRDRLLATLGPKLEILRNMPYVLPFELRVRIFREFVHLDKLRRREGNADPDGWRALIMERNGGWGENSPARAIIGRHSARIRRDSVFESALDQFWELGEGLKEPIQITFIDEFGYDEAGIDGGGVTKEFLTCALLQVLSPEEEFFQSNKENAIFPNPMKLDQLKQTLKHLGLQEGSEAWNDEIASLMKQYEFVGRMIGKCMYEGILIDFAFAGFFLQKWALSATGSTYRASINGLREMDEDLYKGMLQLKNYDGNVADLDLDFTIEDQVSRGNERLQTVQRSLIPNGDKIAVTNENRPLYISYVARHRLMAQPYLVTKAFLRGLGTIIDPMWLRMFNQNELQRLVGGDSSEIDVDDLRRNTIYAGVYEIGDDHQEHPTVKLFWDVVRTLEDADRRLLLKYVTSTPRAPLLGFSQLNPKFSIRDGGSDETRLPSTSTCVNLLKLPRYSTAKTLRDKLLYAIRSNARFDLS